MKILEPSLPKSLAPLNLSSISDETESIEDSSLDNLVIDISHRNFSITRSLINKSDFTASDLEGLGLDNVIVKNCTITAGKFSEASWHTVLVSNSRCSGIQLDRSTLKNVTFRGCKLDIANLRYARLTNVLFDSCVIDEMDLYNAELKNVRFVNCEINNLELQNTKMKNVDLRESTLIRVKRVADLKGALITSEQLIFLSPQLAQQSGITVED